MATRPVVVLLSGVSAAGSSGWVDVSHLVHRSVHVKFAGPAGGDSIEFRGHNGFQQPAANDDGVLLGSAVTADEALFGFATIPYCRWIKAKKVGTAQSVTVTLAGAAGVGD